MQNSIEKLAEALKEVTGTPSNVYAHGPGGLLSPAGLRPGIANAMIMPELGLMTKLAARTTNETNPLWGIFTGVSASTGTEPATRCEDPMTAGVSSLGTVSLPMGWFGRRSRELRLDRFGLVTNRGEFTDMRLMGNPFAGEGVPSPTLPGQSIDINTELGKMMFELAVAMCRDMAPDIYSGNPTNNSGTVGNSGREYYRGLDLLINTNYQDAITGVAMPAADSIVVPFAQNITDTNAGVELVKYITYMVRNLEHIAVRTGLSPVTWTLAMSRKNFYEITAIWPCSYQTFRCDLEGQNNRAVSDRASMNKFTDDMRNGKYLLVDGKMVNVTIDDAIDETEVSPGVFSSDIYFVPLFTGSGGGAALSEGGNLLTYMEFANFNRPDGPMAGARALAPAGKYQTSGDGRYMFYRLDPKYMCVQIAGFVQPRLVLETPFLAARLTGVQTQPLLNERDSFTDGSYFVAGGREDFIGYGPSYYPPTP